MLRMETFRGPTCHVFVPAYWKAEWKKNAIYSHMSKSVVHLGKKRQKKIRQDIFLKEVKVKKRKAGEKGILTS